MSGMIDLMPQVCRETLGRRAWVRRWVLAFSAVIVVLVGSWMWVESGGSGRRARLSDLTRERDLRLSQNERAQELAAEIGELEAAIKRYNRLAWPVRISRVMDTFGAFVPDSVTLTSLSLTPREVEDSYRDDAGKRQKRKRSILVVEAEGVGPNDHVIAVLVSRLESHALFSSVALDYARSEVVGETEARSFRVTGVIDLEKRYQYADAAGSETGGAW